LFLYVVIISEHLLETVNALAVDSECIYSVTGLKASFSTPLLLNIIFRAADIND